jgi:hypothetical protein
LTGPIWPRSSAWRQHGTAKRARHYGISSLAPTAGPPERLLGLKRAHWHIENDLHRTKDVTLDEDQSTTHMGQGPIVLALLRDTALNLLRQAGIHHIAARLRAHSQDPTAAIAVVLAAPYPTLVHKPWLCNGSAFRYCSSR